MNIEYLEDIIESKKLTVAVFGLGRIGLPTALMYAKGGYQVNGIDINLELIEDLKLKKTFIDEPGLPEILNDMVDSKKITFSDNFEFAIKNSDVIVICVPTPVSINKVPNYVAIKDVAQKIGKFLSPNKIIINESSVSPTTIETIITPIIEHESHLKVNDDFGICSCPERADPGKIVENWNKVARIVGGSSDEIGKTIVKLYQQISLAQIYQVSTPGTANAVKLTENIFRDVNIALMNEFAVLYERLGIDVKEVIEGSSTKYNFQPHYPGPGVGGPCLPANSYYIIQDAEKVDYIPFLIRVSREINDRMPQNVLELIINALNYVGKSLKNSTITVLGVSYKANVRDIQISPAMKVIEYLQMKEARIQVWDPYYKSEKIGNFTVSDNLSDSFENSDCVVILTDHKEFFNLNFDSLKNQTNGEFVIVDSRNIYDCNKLPKDTIYCGVGRKLQKL
ncbi:UDP-N-acetyl-D-mannosamine dehydrogenase [Candidatus Lokiarchaeum ossiferum]|uniref:UDP-N-acetyl-D-mannosamine dehydrogenase n=1 Tax=Candidatus Lokiarchaeum ossiferum TaxID=2951803 RepID=A0ABY6HWZ4_9ARCH|nr:UDP-N-acetyl-D-mannosamine dehydrogenase [Candidatus Lokiarchaeum sp. B-35]